MWPYEQLSSLTDRGRVSGPDERSRVVYVGAMGRSGSTVVERMLDQVEGIVCVGELVEFMDLWMWGGLERERCGCGALIADCPFWSTVRNRTLSGWSGPPHRALLATKRRASRIRSVAPAIMSGPRSRWRQDVAPYVYLLERVYRAIADVSGAAVIVDASKSPAPAWLLRRMPTVDLRLIHLVRDVRGVALSWSKSVPRPHSVDRDSYLPTYAMGRTAATWDLVNFLFEALRVSGVPTLTVRYEDVVEHPADQVKKMLRHCGLDPTEDSLSFIDGRSVQLEPGHGIAGNPVRFSSGRIELLADIAWREELAPRARALIGALSWPLAARYRAQIAGSDGRPIRRVIERIGRTS